MEAKVKKCTNCGTELVEGNHYKKRNICKACYALVSRKIHLKKQGRFEEAEKIVVITKIVLTDEEKAERKKANRKAYNERNRESINAKKKEVYYSKQDYFIAKQKQYYRENKEEINKRVVERRRIKRKDDQFAMFLQGISESINKQIQKGE